MYTIYQYNLDESLYKIRQKIDYLKKNSMADPVNFEFVYWKVVLHNLRMPRN